EPILTHAIDRLALSEANDEAFGAEMDGSLQLWQSSRAGTHALGLWLAGRPDPPALHERAAERLLACLPRLTLRDKPRELGYFAFGYLGEHLRSCVESGRAAEGCAHYESMVAAVVAANKKEASGSKLAHAFCLAVRDHGVGSKEATRAGEKILK